MNSKHSYKDINILVSAKPSANQKAWNLIHDFYHMILTYMEKNDISKADLAKKLGEACMKQIFVRKSAVTFIWTTIPYRTEWRYDKVSHKIIAQDAGHMCQNLYLAAGAIGAGTCAIGAYYQNEVDELIGVDGQDEFTVYIAPVGKLETTKRARI